MSMFSRQLPRVLLMPMACLLFLAGLAVAQDAAVDKETKAKEYYNEGVKAMQDGKVNEAVTAYEAAIGLSPDYADARLNLGVIYFQQRAYDKALEQFRRVTELNPQNVDAFANLGRVHYLTRNWGEAEVAFRAALAIDPNRSDLYVDLGKTLLYMKEYQEVISVLEKGHTSGAGDEVSFYTLGKAYEETGQTDKAIVAYKESITKDSKYYSSRSALGSIYLQQEKFRQAATEFRAALQASPNRYRAAYNFAVAMESADPDAITDNIANWEAFVKLARNNPKAKNDVAVAESHIDDLKERKQVLDLNQ